MSEKTGDTKMHVMETENNLGLMLCQKLPLVIERGEGAWVWDDQGNTYLDFTSGWGVTCLGHSHPAMIQALHEQAGKIMQNPNSGFTYSPARAALLQSLQQVLPAGLDRTFFASSGAEANDAAVKLARKVTGRVNVVAIKDSFHGRTLAALSMSGDTNSASRFLPYLSGHSFVEREDFSGLQNAITSDVAAVIVEPVQGEGGVRALSPEFFQEIRRLCDQNGALLVVDEVQTGFCRTGHFFAIDDYKVRPDILTMGKGIAGGLPFAAFSVTQAIAQQVGVGDHGGTYCGNPLSCAVAKAVLDTLLEQKLSEHAAMMGEQALNDLEQLAEKYPQSIACARGKGLMLALQLRTDDQDLVWALTAACQRNGLLVIPTRGGVLRLLPPLTISLVQWRDGMSRLEAALSGL
ncbi:acetylornithine aminotransferase [Pseudohongiella nitratireducens]|uniref:Acetylornithine aminotransferase n=1 Tax=Pseudohongiella nitratireducens TaxID=1768907 RepID=A0A917LUA5_9GAMM|nr:aspartate aminotransferase family protein [Pseudohongiella nitratireducens]MDF1623087.1 aspartate aminotransferase family protein [Pseudohongiella nitratireducens]GGG57858.1 acetylornithine aminotransferase [Pseudohongiella nitratireducens]|tara:strand:- start:6272 stop:7489 length:1218 start_codon:yes stop_codon:yes gene_type:complete